MKKQKFTKKYIDILVRYGMDDVNHEDISVITYKRGEFICMQGNALEYVMIFIKGKAKVFFTSPNGKTLLMAYYTQMGLIGDSELMGDQKTATSGVQAITDVECIGIPLNRYKNYLKNNIKFMNIVGLELANKLHNNTTNNAFNILHPLEARVCTYILMTNEDGFFKEKLTDLSEFMGTSYRHLLRTLERLCDDGIIKKEDRGYQVVDLSLLEDRADK